MTRAITLRAAALTLALSVLLAGCAQPLRGPWYANAPAPPDSANQATVYLLRLTSPWFGYPINRYRLDGAEAAKLTDREFTWMQVSPGKHTLEARGYSALDTVEFNARAGETIYVVFKLRNADRGRFFFNSESTRIARTTFERISKEEAQVSLATLSYSASIL